MLLRNCSLLCTACSQYSKCSFFARNSTFPLSYCCSPQIKLVQRASLGCIGRKRLDAMVRKVFKVNCFVAFYGTPLIFSSSPVKQRLCMRFNGVLSYTVACLVSEGLAVTCTCCRLCCRSLKATRVLLSWQAFSCRPNPICWQSAGSRWGA